MDRLIPGRIARILAFACLLCSATALAEEVNVLITFREQDLPKSLERILIPQFQASMEKAYPGRRLIVVKARTPGEIHKSLLRQLPPSARIASLILDGHGPGEGHGSDHRPTFRVGTRDGSSRIYLTNPSSVMRALSPLVGRFTESASITIDGCGVVSGAGPELQRIFKTVARNFGLKSGKLFMAAQNTVPTPLSLRSRMTAPDQVLEEQLVARAADGFDIDRAAAPLAYLINWLHLRLTMNAGWTLSVEHGTSILMTDRFENAMATSHRDFLVEHDRRRATQARLGTPLPARALVIATPPALEFSPPAD